MKPSKQQAPQDAQDATDSTAPLYLETVNTAPQVGLHHKKTNSLIGFDPLLNDERRSTLTPPPSVGRSRCESAPSPQALLQELNELAAEVKQISPVPSTPGRGKKLLNDTVNKLGGSVKKLGMPWSPRHSRQGSLNAATITPPHNINNKDKKHHRKTHSDMNAQMSKQASGLPPASPQTNLTPQPYQTSTLSSPMMAELWSNLQQPVMDGSTPSAVDALQLPSLAKPRPTSFLTTGNELLVRSSEQDASDWQVAIPPLDDVQCCAKLCQFLETYFLEEPLDLQSLVGHNRMQLSSFAQGNTSLAGLHEIHRPTVEALVDCDKDLVQVHASIVSGQDHAGQGRQVLIVERQRQLLVIVRGTLAEQQQYKFTTKLNETEVIENVTVFKNRLKAFAEIQSKTFETLDQFTLENPFCDIVFAGHAFGGALATLGAYLYASSRPDIRVGSLVTASTKVGLENFRLSAHSLPNLKLFRVDLGRTHQQGMPGSHVGHSIVIDPSILTKAKKEASLVLAYKFGGDQTNVRKLLFQRDRDYSVAEYVDALDGLSEEQWVKDYVHYGEGIPGDGNETRNVV